MVGWLDGMVDAEIQERILKIVEENPGLIHNDIWKRLQRSKSCMRTNLLDLIEQVKIVDIPDGKGKVRYFPPDLKVLENHFMDVFVTRMSLMYGMNNDFVKELIKKGAINEEALRHFMRARLKISLKTRGNKIVGKRVKLSDFNDILYKYNIRELNPDSSSRDWNLGTKVRFSDHSKAWSTNILEGRNLS